MEEIIAKETSHALRELFKNPIGEVGNLITDRIRYARWKSAVKILERAREISESQGRKLSQPELKFLVPFLEKASLEDDRDDSLQEKWAQLLISASDGDVQNDSIFIDVLSKIKSHHVYFLDRLCSGWPAHWIEESAEWSLEAQFPDLIDRVIENFCAQKNGEIVFNGDVSGAYTFLFENIEQPGQKLFYLVTSDRNVKNDVSWEMEKTAFDGIDTSRTSAALEALGLVRNFDIYDWHGPQPNGGLGYAMSGTTITRLGVEFVVACGFEISKDAENVGCQTPINNKTDGDE